MQSALSWARNVCNYLALSQPALQSLAPGDGLRIRLIHYDLVAQDPAEAHMAVLAQDVVLWEQRVAIPKPAAVIEVCIPMGQRIFAGTPIGFHLHNHGQNSWKLLDVSRVAQK